MKFTYFTFIFFINISLFSCEKNDDSNREFAQSALRDMESYHGIPAIKLAVSNQMPDARGCTQGVFPPYLITLNRSIMAERQDILSVLSHEVGHAKDHSLIKHAQALNAYYALAAATPNVLTYVTSKLLSLKAFTNTTLRTALTAAGLASALFFHKETDRLISRHLEKRADLIGLDYLVSHHQFESVCRQVAYLESAHFYHTDKSPNHPCAQEALEYTKKFLEKKGISLTSEFKEHNQTLNGSITLRKDNQKLYDYTWQGNKC